MASVGEPTSAKRPHIKTERMQEFIKTHGDISPQKQLKCTHEGCSKVLSSIPGLRYHVQTYHSQVKEYICPKCNRVFKSANGLKYHTGKTKCDDCHANLNEDMSYGVTNITHSESVVNTTESKKQQGKRVPPPPPLILKSDSVISLENTEDFVSSTDGASQGSNLLNTGDKDKFLSEEAGRGRLEEFAIFATSPQSPLMQRILVKPWDKPTGPVIRRLAMDECPGVTSKTDFNECQQDHSYSHCPEPQALSIDVQSENKHRVSSTVDSNGNYFSDGSDPHVTSSSPYPTSPGNLESPTATWSHKWPTAVWQCFTEGTKIFFLCDTAGSEWKKVHDLARLDNLKESATWNDGKNNTRYAQNGLLLLKIDHHQDVDNIAESVTQLHFTPNIPGQADLIAECTLDHPFFVKDKGWSSYHPDLTAEHYGIPCNILEVNDICLPPSHPEATLGEDILESFISSDLTPMDSSAVFTLQNMAKQRRDLELSPKSTGSPTKKRQSKNEPSKAKRPMNAFMLFAKEFRLEYTQKYPGKDNRAISVMLGDTWKKMNSEERNVYAEKAKSLAELQKKMHPDCWKRKK